MSFQNSQYNLPLTQAYNSILFAFPATGSFTLTKVLPTVTMDPSSLLQSIDVSGSLQFNIPLSYFNINSSTDESGNLVNDSITFTSENLKQIITTSSSSIASSGSLSSIFLNYDNYVNAYFGNTSGFTLPFSLLNSSNTASYNNNGYIDGFSTSAADRILTNNQIITLLNSDLSGSLTVGNLTKLLTFVCSKDTFNNRGGAGASQFTGGFKAGDLIYFSNGIQINLRTNINNNGIAKIATTATIASFNAIDLSFSTGYDINNTSGSLMNYTFSNSNNNTYLTSNVSIPVLLRLVANL
jgi:hypothetical protein